MTTATNISDDFRDAIEQAGLVPPSVIPPGKLIRFPGVGKSNGNTSGWAKLFEDGEGGVYGDWASGLYESWQAKRSTQRTPKEQTAFTRRVAEEQRLRAEEDARVRAQAAEYAQQFWENAAPATAEHPYLKMKQVQPRGLRLDAQNNLIVPVLIKGQIASLQFIDGTGAKLFLKDGEVKAGSYSIGELTNSSAILLCEGFATAASLFEATGYPAICAFSAGNLLPVAQQLRQEFPTTTIVLCGDNDLRTDGTPNTGLEAAIKAAGAIRGLLVMPELNGQKCDWNDVHTQHGLDVVTRAIAAALHTAQPSEEAHANPSPEEPYRCTDVGNAEVFAQQHGERVRYCFGFKQWYVWDGQRWRPDDGGDMTRLAKQTALSLYARAAQEPDESRRKTLAKWAAESETERRLKSMVNLAQSEPGIAIAADQLDTDLLLLNVQNGTVDLRTGELREARRNDFITKLAPVAYRPDATCPIFDQMLQRLFETVPAVRRYLHRIFGYALTGLTIEQCFFLFYGKGANGKTTLLTAILNLLGEYADASRPETFLVKHGDGGIPNDVAALAGKRFVISLESEKGKRLAEGLVKGLTGGDKMKARFLHKEFFSFDPRFKLFIGTNHKPTISGTDDGIWRRVRCVPFAVQIPETDKDKHLPAKLELERAGLLNWLLQGCLAWQREGLGEPLEIVAATADYRDEQDVLGVFLKDRCVVATTAKSTKKELYDDYTVWCDESGERHRLTMREFGKVLRERGMVDAKISNAKGFVGLRLRTPVDADPDDEEPVAAHPEVVTDES